LKEEVKIMHMAHEFLDDECENFIETHTEVNDCLLSCLNDSIQHIRLDFEQLNDNQLKQLEDGYQQQMLDAEENLRQTSVSLDSTMTKTS
jgi:hypothetical protein